MKKILIAVIVVAAVAAAAFSLKKGRRPFGGEGIHPTRGSIGIEFRETGSVSPRNRLEIKPPVAGRVEEVLVAEGQKVKKGEIIAWMSSSDRAALLDTARARGAEELKQWEDAYKPTPIISPIDGFIIARSREPGQTVALSDVLLVMADTLIVEAVVDETDLRHIRLGQKVRIFLDAYPDKKFAGVVEHVAYESQLVNNVTVYTVKIRPLETSAFLRAGMTATVEVKVNHKDGALLLASEAIISKDNKYFVLLKGKGRKPELREVETGITSGKNVEIVSGLTEDDEVLLPEKKTGGKENPQRTRRFGGIPGIGRQR